MNADKDRGPQSDEGGATEVDVRGLVCPEPVVRTRKAIESTPRGKVVVLTDSPTSRDNIVRFAERAGCQVSCKEREPGVYAVTIVRGSQVAAPCAKTGTAVFVSSDRLGRGDDKLGKLLMGLFLRTLVELPSRPASLALMNSGVKLSLAESEVLDALKTLENQGTEVRVCGTCLDFFGLKDQVRVGTVSNMYELAEMLMDSDKVIGI